MATFIRDGQTTWKMTRDEVGHRTYNITFRVASDITDGPANVLQTPGLPEYGSTWEFDDDVDVWAWCRWNADVRPVLEGEPNTEWTVEFIFSTKADVCCRDTPVEDPLLQPMVVTGGSVKYTEEATHDWRGDPVQNSALEQIRGPQNEWDANRSSVKITQNVANLDLAAVNAILDCVNDAPMWGEDKWNIKLSSFTWEQKYYGQCNLYYVRHFEFEINKKGWARDVLDEGSKALNGHHGASTGAWVLDNINGAAPDPTNPLHYTAYQDRAGNVCRVVLDGAGKPYAPTDPDSGADEQWWGVLFFEAPADATDTFITGADGTVYQSPNLNRVIQGTCNTAKNYAKATGGKLKGPWDTEAEARASTRPPNTYEGAVYHYDLVCEDGSDGPGKIHIDKYQAANFLLLGLPTTL